VRLAPTDLNSPALHLTLGIILGLELQQLIKEQIGLGTGFERYDLCRGRILFTPNSFD